MDPVPTSKTRLTACVKAFDTDAVVAGLKLRPGLLHYADERGRNWLHLCASIDVRKRGLDPADAVPLAGALLDLGIDVNAAAFTEGTWRATPLWYAISRGGNIDLARYLLTSGVNARALPLGGGLPRGLGHDRAARRCGGPP